MGAVVQLERIEISKLSNDPANARKHSERNIETIVASLRRFGQQKPIVIDKTNVVRAGNGTLEAAKQIGWTHIDCVRTTLESSDAIAYAIADNRTSELAEWDQDVLAAQLNGLLADDEELLEAAGFDEDDLNELLGDIDDNEETLEVAEDEVLEVPVEPITKPGDLWILGKHRLLCGDSTKAEDVDRLMNGEKANLCFTSPPYGQQRDYTKEGKEKCQDWDGLMQGVFANLPMSETGQVLVNLGLIHRDGEWIPYWDGWVEFMRSQGWRRFGWYVWDQTYGLPGDWQGRLAPSHEFVFHFNKQAKKPDKFVAMKPGSTEKAKRTAERMQNGESVPCMRKKDGSTGVMSSSPVNTVKIPDSVIRIVRNQANDIARKNHPATFPVEFPSFAMKCWEGDVYEPFCGSGTTLIAAEQLGRTCYGMEISPQYCDVIVKRWENLTGEKAICQSATLD
jgi:DNA modification methylase